jgi:pyruvate/oxaloacetate carboxyltransferase
LVSIASSRRLRERQDVFRVFDGLNDVRNLTRSIEVVSASQSTR